MRPGSGQTWGLLVQCAAADHYQRQAARSWRLAGLAFAMSTSIAGADMSMAQTKAPSEIAVTCIGSDQVAADTLAALCVGLQDALTTKYPSLQFVASAKVPENPAPVVMLEAFSASKAGIAARLNWRASGGSAVVNGPRFGFSISDKDMTPAMQLQFLNRLVHDTALPF